MWRARAGGGGGGKGGNTRSRRQEEQNYVRASPLLKAEAWGWEGRLRTKDIGGNFATLTDFSTSSSSNTPLTTLVEHLLQWATPQLGLVFIGRDSRRRAHTGCEVIDSELCTRRDSASAWHRAKVCARTMGNANGLASTLMQWG